LRAPATAAPWSGARLLAARVRLGVLPVALCQLFLWHPWQLPLDCSEETIC
jgi:hypothetical protein